MGMSGDDGCSFLLWRSLGHSRRHLVAFRTELPHPPRSVLHWKNERGLPREGGP